MGGLTGHYLHKREADASFFGYGPARAYHPYGGSSYTYRSTQGLTGHYLHKREADAGHIGYGSGYSHQYVSRPFSAYNVNVRHDLYKREADASYHGSSADVHVSVSHPYGYQPAHYNYGFNIHSHGKRSAEPHYYNAYGGRSYFHEQRPHYSFGYGQTHHFTFRHPYLSSKNRTNPT